MNNIPKMASRLSSYSQGCGHSNIIEKCIIMYDNITKTNKSIDPGHAIGHVMMVRERAEKGLSDLLNGLQNPQMYLGEHYETWKDNLAVPPDVRLRIDVATLLHESGDKKFKSLGDTRTEKERVSDILNSLFEDLEIAGTKDVEYLKELKHDIGQMIDLCSTSTWGDTYPPGTKLYQLIPRWADRLEATGVIGVVRTMTYGFSVIVKQPWVNIDDRFPKSQEELDNVASYESFLQYVERKGGSKSTWEHLQDKIRHISGKHIPIRYFRDEFNTGQRFVDQFILDFTNVHGKRWNIDSLLSAPDFDQEIYIKEAEQLQKIRDVLSNDPRYSRWIC